MLSFLPVLSRAKRRLLSSSSALLDRATEIVELEPASTFECAPAISLPGELDRVQRFEGAPEHQVNRLTRRECSEGPTLSYLLPKAVLADFTVYARGGYEVYRSARKRPILSGTADHFHEAQLCTTSCAEVYFGHFIREALPLELLAERRGLLPLAFPRPPWVHEARYRALMSMTGVMTAPFATVEKLWITDERSLNAGWQSRFEELRQRLRSNICPIPSRGVFLRRGKLGAGRVMTNEDELAEQLQKHGFETIVPEEMTADEIAALVSGAETVICVEGSVQQHALAAMPRGSALLSIQPPLRFNTIAKVIADRIGVRFSFTVADPAEGGFSLSPERLLKTHALIR